MKFGEISFKSVFAPICAIISYINSAWRFCMSNIMDNILGYAIAAVVIAVFVVICFIIAKKDRNSLDDILKKIPEENKELLKAQPYQQQDSKGVKFNTLGLVADIKENGDKATLTLLFYNEPRDEFYSQTTKLKTTEVHEKGYKPLDMLPCEMKYDAEYHVHNFKKLI